MHALYAQLVRLCTVPPVSNPKDKWANYADVPEILLALCTPTLAHRGDGAARVRRLPVLVDVSDAPTEYDWAHLPFLEAFLEKTGLVKLLPLDPGSLQLHQFFCLVNPAVSNSSPASFHRILEVFEWSADELMHLLLRILVHPLPNLSPGWENWSDTRLATRLIQRLGSCVAEWAPSEESIATLNASLTPELPEWAQVPATAIAFHAKWLRETEFDGFLAWMAVQNLEIVPAYIEHCTKSAIKGSGAVKRTLQSDHLVEAFQCIFKSGRDADVFVELEWHREMHCLKGKARDENCPYNAEHMRGGQLMHQWCRCSGARLVGHIDPMWTLAQAEEPGSALECALRAVIEALGDDMPRRMTLHVPKCKESETLTLRPMMQKNVTSPLIHMGRYLPALVQTVLDARATYFRESGEGKADLAELFSHLLRWTVPREQLLRNQHGGAKVPGKQYEHYTACRADLVTTLLEPPWSLLPPHWNNPLAAGWYQRTHGRDPNVTGAPVSVWDEELADGITAKHVTPMTDAEKVDVAKAQGRYVDLNLLGPEQLCVKVKIEGTDGEYETVYNTYEEEAPAKWKQTQRLDLGVHSSKRLLRQSTLLSKPREPGQLQITELESVDGGSSSSRLSWTPSAKTPRRGWQADATQVHEIRWMNNGDFPWTYQAQLALVRPASLTTNKALKYNYVNLGFQGNPEVARTAMVEFVRETKRAGIRTVFSFEACFQKPDEEVEEQEAPLPPRQGSDTESNEEPLAVVDDSTIDDETVNMMMDLLEELPESNPTLTPRAQAAALVGSIRYPYANQEVAERSARKLTAIMRDLTQEQKTPAMHLALNLPIGKSKSIDDWAIKLKRKRKPYTIKTGIVHALNPQKSANWAMYETGAISLEVRAVAGIALNLRCHPFLKEDVDALMKALPDRVTLEQKKAAVDNPKLEARAQKAEQAAKEAKEKTTNPILSGDQSLVETLKSQSAAFSADDVAMQVTAAKAVARQVAAEPDTRHDFFDALNVPLNEWTWSENVKRRVRVVYREPVLCSGFHDDKGTLPECYRPSTDEHGKPVEQPSCAMPEVYYGTLRIIEQEGMVALNFLWSPHNSYKDTPGHADKAWKSFVRFDSRQVTGLIWPKGAHLSHNRIGTVVFTGNKTPTTKHHVIFCFGAPVGESTTYTSRFTTFIEHVERHFRLAPDRSYTGETQLVDVMNGRHGNGLVGRFEQSIKLSVGYKAGDEVMVTMVNDAGMVDDYKISLPVGYQPNKPFLLRLKLRREMSQKGLHCARVWKVGLEPPAFTPHVANLIAKSGSACPNAQPAWAYAAIAPGRPNTINKFNWGVAQKRLEVELPVPPGFVQGDFMYLTLSNVSQQNFERRLTIPEGATEGAKMLVAMQIGKDMDANGVKLLKYHKFYKVTEPMSSSDTPLIDKRLVATLQSQSVKAATPAAADSAYTEDVVLNIVVPEGYAVGDRMKVTLVNDDGMVDTFLTTIPDGFVTAETGPISCHFKTRKTQSHKGLRCAKVWKLGAAEPPFSLADANAIIATAKAPGKTDAALLAEKLKEVQEQQQLMEIEKRKRQQAALTAPPAPAPEAAAAPAKRELVVDNDGTVSTAPEPKRQACGDKEDDPIVLE